VYTMWHYVKADDEGFWQLCSWFF